MLPLQSDWSLFCDHGLDYASFWENSILHEDIHTPCNTCDRIITRTLAKMSFDEVSSISQVKSVCFPFLCSKPTPDK